MLTQRQLAERLGLSQTTVSLALRGSHLIPAATRQRVVALAAKHGYQPNPLVAALMSHISTGRKVKDQGCLALVVDFPSLDAWQSYHVAYPQHYTAIQRRAAERGYRTECFFLRAPAMSAAKIDRILKARGIVGVILAAPRLDRTYEVVLSWDRYACAKAGYSWELPLVDCVAPHNRHHVEMAFRELTARGYRRIGYCVRRPAIVRTDSSWAAGHHVAQLAIPVRQRVPLLVYPSGTASREKFRRWFQRWQPDVIIGEQWDYQWMQELCAGRKSPRGFCSVFRHPGSTVTAIEENWPIIGETVCDLVIDHLVQNRRGLPTHPKLVLIEGTWCPGNTTR